MDNENINEEENYEQIEEQTPKMSEIREFRNKLIMLLVCILIVLYAALLIYPTTMQNTHKPAIYLYPVETSKISVKLDKSIKYNNVIPNYKDGWYVEAESNGNIRDLQPEYTKCESLPYTDFGFEYSKKSCEMNNYPYIYWDGFQANKLIPNKKEGFIVKLEDIESFLNSKADEMNFNDKEKSEFVRYWIKKIQERNWKTYKIYFLQNEEVDNYYPIFVNPKPDNINRVQIIIKKAKKNEKIQKQELIPFKRDGYTLVEWGGII